MKLTSTNCNKISCLLLFVSKDLCVAIAFNVDIEFVVDVDVAVVDAAVVVVVVITLLALLTPVLLNFLNALKIVSLSSLL